MLHECFEVTAIMQQGVVLDAYHGLPLDSILASQLRAATGYEGGVEASSLDGGLDTALPRDWELPLSVCGDEASDDWHWLATGALPVDVNGSPLSSVDPPDIHRMSVQFDDARYPQVAISIPKEAGGSRGRYRARLSPVITVPCHALIWRGVGDARAVSSLLSSIPAIGGRRSSGEGAVMKWNVSIVEPDDLFLFAHTHRNGVLGRPVPVRCAERLESVPWREGRAGIRPPVFHSSRQRTLAVPTN